VNGVSVGR